MRKIFLILAVLFSLQGFSQSTWSQEQDNKDHWGAGLLISSASYTFIYERTGNTNKAFFGSTALALGAGLLKESIGVIFQGKKFKSEEVLYTGFGAVTGAFGAGLIIDIGSHTNSPEWKANKKLWKNQEKLAKAEEKEVRKEVRAEDKEAKKARKQNKKSYATQ